MEQGRPAMGTSNLQKRTASKISTAAGAVSEVNRRKVKGRRTAERTPAPTEPCEETSLHANSPSQTPEVQGEQGNQEEETSAPPKETQAADTSVPAPPPAPEVPDTPDTPNPPV